MQGGCPGERCALQRKTGIDEKHMCKPYAPSWRQGTGEGEELVIRSFPANAAWIIETRHFRTTSKVSQTN